MIDSILDFLAANQQALWKRTWEHLDLMFVALAAATMVGVPAGIVAARIRWLAAPFVTAANIVQTIPSIALLGFLLPIMGIGRGTAILALFLYALLPILRNTITGLQGVDRGVRDAARGIGMNDRQILMQIDFPLALPVIFAGIRTAAVINVGVTTLSALVGAGGLGTFIFRGLATSNMATILLGAVPAAVLALLADSLLSLGERVLRHRKALLWVGLLALLGGGLLALRAPRSAVGPNPLRFGFTSEFMERGDGYKAWKKHYGLGKMETRELDPGLLYQALNLGEVDAACGFSTDGRIDAFDLRPLEDDREFFPPYEAAWLVRQETLDRHPELATLLSRLEGALDEKTMRRLNRRADLEKISPARVAADFLADWTDRQGIGWQDPLAREPADDAAPADVVVGTKNFTEQYVLGQIITQLINGATSLRASLKPGLGGTSVCFEALVRGDLDIYPEYSGTLLATVVEPPPDLPLHDRQAVGDFLNTALRDRHNLAWMAPLGFSNTYALLVRRKDPRFSDVLTLSDLAEQMRAASPSGERKGGR
jgi:osmoprotectant transport system permease protein